DTLGYNDGTGGSRVTYSTGVAVYRACQDAIAKLRPRAALLLEAKEEEVTYADGVFRAANGREIRTKEVIRQLNKTGGPIEATGISGRLQRAPAFSASLVDVEVDPETGKTRILRWTQFQDVGKAIHPSYVEGQLDRKSTRLNSSHVKISYAVFCLKKKKKNNHKTEKAGFNITFINTITAGGYRSAVIQPHSFF